MASATKFLSQSLGDEVIYLQTLLASSTCASTVGPSTAMSLLALLSSTSMFSSVIPSLCSFSKELLLSGTKVLKWRTYQLDLAHLINMYLPTSHSLQNPQKMLLIYLAVDWSVASGLKPHSSLISCNVLWLCDRWTEAVGCSKWPDKSRIMNKGVLPWEWKTLWSDTNFLKNFPMVVKSCKSICHLC